MKIDLTFIPKAVSEKNSQLLSDLQLKVHKIAKCCFQALEKLFSWIRSAFSKFSKASIAPQKNQIRPAQTQQASNNATSQEPLSAWKFPVTEEERASLPVKQEIPSPLHPRPIMSCEKIQKTPVDQSLEQKKAQEEAVFSQEFASFVEDLEQMRIPMPLELSAIESRYPALSEQIASSPEKAQAYNTIINKFQVARALKNRTEFRIGPLGKRFLEKAGYRVGDYDDMPALIEKYEEAGNALLNRSKTVSPESFKELLKSEFLKVFLEYAQVPEEHCEQFTSFIDAIRTIYKEVQLHYQENVQTWHFSKLSSGACEKFPKFAIRLDNHMQNEIQKRYAEHFMKLLDKLFSENGGSLNEEFKEAIEIHKQEILSTLPPFEELAQEIEKTMNESLLKEISFYEFLASTVQQEGIFEYRQGEEGEGTALGEGVCFGLCLEHLVKFLENPDRKLNSEEELTISPKARFFQATKGIVDQLEKPLTAPQQRKLPFTEELAEAFTYKNTLKQILQEVLKRPSKINQSLQPLFEKLSIDLDSLNRLLDERKELLSALHHRSTEQELEEAFVRAKQIYKELEWQLSSAKGLRSKNLSPDDLKKLFEEIFPPNSIQGGGDEAKTAEFFERQSDQSYKTKLITTLKTVSKRDTAQAEAAKNLLFLLKEGLIEIVPEELQKKMGIECDHSENASSLLALLEWNIPAFQDSILRRFNKEVYREEPACFLNINVKKGGGHGLYMRFDEAEGRYIFFDPNFGTFERRTQNHEKGIRWLAQVLAKCLQFYGTDRLLLLEHYSKK